MNSDSKWRDSLEIFEWLMTMSDEETMYYAQHAKGSGHMDQEHIKVAFKKRAKKFSKSFTDKRKGSNIKK